ncbi:MAG: FG-GAP repeat domain-containing protein, partial [Pirellulaceae bacterium]
MRTVSTALLCVAPVLVCQTSPPCQAQSWEDRVLPIELTVGYAVRAIDMNADRKLDIAIVDSKRIVWLENPSWTAHTIDQTPDGQADNVCFAPLDIDADGDLDLAIGGDWQPNNTTSGGSLAWLEAPSDPTQRWTRHTIADDLPTLHRMQWADIDADQRMELIVVPLKGRGSQPPGWDDQPVAVTRWNPPASPATMAWKSEIIESTLPVMHNFQPIDFDGDRRHDLLLASFEGVHLWTQPDPSQRRQLVHLGAGHAGAAPAKGASEIRLGFLSKSQRFLATIEPWHGNQVVVYEQPSEDQPLI